MYYYRFSSSHSLMDDSFYATASALCNYAFEIQFGSSITIHNSF